MQKELNDIQIPIPSQLDDRVEEALGQVRRIHRGKVLRRVATPLATQATLRFYDANRGQQVLAEFTIDLSAQTVTS